MSLGRVLGTSLLLGAGVVAAAAIVAGPRLFRAARPLLREGLGRGLGLYRRARAAMAEFADDVEDLVAEAKSDLTARPGEEGPPADRRAAPSA